MKISIKLSQKYIICEKKLPPSNKPPRLPLNKMVFPIFFQDISPIHKKYKSQNFTSKAQSVTEIIKVFREEGEHSPLAK